METPSIYDTAGGAPAFLALAAEHHRRCLADPLLAHPFSHGARPDHVERLAAYWGEVLGGPPRYTQRYGGEAGMMEMHAGYGIDAATGERFVECFMAAVDAVGMPDEPALRQALGAYMEWAVAGVLARQAPGTTADAGAVTPRWGWDGPASTGLFP